MARRTKSLHFNKEDGVDIPYHRDHRAKKNRTQKSSTIAYRLYKLKKKGYLD